ncbi:MAG: radical SAM protein [Acidobacteria bacterium]|nr:MAG: radical SAM protein [Acidobacteriota bacterium]
MQALLISTYEMGRQPFGLASPAAWLRTGGWDVVCVDVSKERLRDADVKSADVIAFHLPMHTATRLAAPVIAKARALNRSARICAYGLYAPLNGQWLRSIGVDAVFGGEFEEELTQWAGATTQGAVGRAFQGRQRGPERPAPQIPRIRFLVPDRSTLPPLSKYATLQLPDGTTRAVGYTEASRGCKHLCRHCPVVPIYNGQFRIVPPGVVLADVAAQVAGGAGHITFGDPDFFNGPTHAMRIVEALHAAHPSVSYDVTIKVEHLLRHRALLPRLAETGCALTFVAFHPWLTPESYCDLLDTIAGLDLVDHVAQIQLAIRLLLPEGSRLLTTPEMRPHVGAFDPKTLTYRWTHPDRAVDALHQEVSTIVGMRLTADRRVVFEEVSRLAHDRAGMPSPSARPFRDRATVPYLNEPWYC